MNCHPCFRIAWCLRYLIFTGLFNKQWVHLSSRLTNSPLTLSFPWFLCMTEWLSTNGKIEKIGKSTKWMQRWKSISQWIGKGRTFKWTSENHQTKKQTDKLTVDKRRINKQLPSPQTLLCVRLCIFRAGPQGSGSSEEGCRNLFTSRFAGNASHTQLATAAAGNFFRQASTLFMLWWMCSYETGQLA